MFQSFIALYIRWCRREWLLVPVLHHCRWFIYFTTRCLKSALTSIFMALLRFT